MEERINETNIDHHHQAFIVPDLIEKERRPDRGINTTCPNNLQSRKGKDQIEALLLHHSPRSSNPFNNSNHHQLNRVDENHLNRCKSIIGLIITQINHHPNRCKSNPNRTPKAESRY